MCMWVSTSKSSHFTGAPLCADISEVYFLVCRGSVSCCGLFIELSFCVELLTQRSSLLID